MSNADSEYRKALFFESAAHIEEHNSQNNGSAKLELNFFSLLNDAERANYLGFKPKRAPRTGGKHKLSFKKLKVLKKRRVRRNHRKTKLTPEQTGAL